MLNPMRTGQSEVCQDGFAAAAARQDMIDGKCGYLSARGQMAVFAAAAGPGDNSVAHFVGEDRHDFPVR